MTWEIGKKELDALLSASGPRRYAYFVKKAVDHGELWTLSGEDGVVLASDSTSELLPIWPHEQFASACAIHQWSNAWPKKVELSTWLEQWSYEMRRDRRDIVVFPTPEGRGVVVKPDRLERDIRDELASYP